MPKILWNYDPGATNEIQLRNIYNSCCCFRYTTFNWVFTHLQMRPVIHFYIHNMKTTFWLTFIQYLEANIWPTVISDKQQIQKVAAAKQKLGNLGAIKGANQRRQEVWPIMDLQDVITQLCLEPVRQEHYRISNQSFRKWSGAAKIFSR